MNKPSDLSVTVTGGAPSRRCPLVALTHVKGGVGVTSLALAICCAALEQEAQRVLLVDADANTFGVAWRYELGGLPDPRPQQGLAVALQGAPGGSQHLLADPALPEEIILAHLLSCVQTYQQRAAERDQPPRHRGVLRMLTGLTEVQRTSEDVVPFHPPAVGRLFTTAQGHYDLIVVDMGRAWQPGLCAALTASLARVVLVTDGTRRAALVTGDERPAIPSGAGGMHLVINRVNSSPRLTDPQIAALCGVMPHLASVPHGSALADVLAYQWGRGAPWPAARKSDPTGYAAAVAELARRLMTPSTAQP